MALVTDFFKYELMPIQRVGAVASIKGRPGALFRFSWPDGKVGYADCFPWPELGDPPLDAHLMAFMQGKITPLVEQTMWLARRDAGWRAEGVNPYKAGARSKNYYLIADYESVDDIEINRAKAAGFTTFKIKCGKDVDEEGKWIDRFVKKFGVLVRVDFNSKISFDLFERFHSHLSTGPKARVEYVEDPLPWDFDVWKEASSLLPLAADGALAAMDLKAMEEKGDQPPFKVVVIKPARIDLEKTLHFADRFGLKIVVTHSLDHPVGQMHAAILANELKKKYPNRTMESGCMPAKIYEPSAFTSMVETKGPYIEGVPGHGIGFDSVLKDLKWAKLR